jgi:hypothetical protein
MTNYKSRIKIATNEHLTPISSQALLAIFVVILFSPAFVFFTFATSSQAPGVIFASLFIIALAFSKLIYFKIDERFTIAIILLFSIFTIIIIHGMIAWYVQTNDLSRMFSSTAGAFICGVAAVIMASTLFKVPDDVMKGTIDRLFVILTVIALLGFLQIRPYEPAFATSNPIFPFTEPSHLALVMAPISLAACVFNRGWKKAAIIATLLLTAFFLRSMSLFVGATIIGAVCLPLRLLIPGTIFVVFLTQSVEIDYFSQRVDFSVHNSNLSNLVYLQGWELLNDSLARSKGWGLGFQQLGIGQYDSPISDIIFRIIESNASIRDGSFTFSKISSEFGIFGIAISIIFLFLAMRSALNLRRSSLGISETKGGITIARAFLVAGLVEFFIRGIGYFSATVLMIIAATIFLSRQGKLM